MNYKAGVSNCLPLFIICPSNMTLPQIPYDFVPDSVMGV